MLCSGKRVLAITALMFTILPALPGLTQQMNSQSGTSGTAGMNMNMSGSPAAQDYEAADQKMMKAMQQPMTGDADRDFAAMMIAHHQGAIDMANVELRYGKDPQLRELAQDIIQAQEKEIAVMREWQTRHGQ